MRMKTRTSSSPASSCGAAIPPSGHYPGDTDRGPLLGCVKVGQPQGGVRVAFVTKRTVDIGTLGDVDSGDNRDAMEKVIGRNGEDDDGNDDKGCLTARDLVEEILWLGLFFRGGGIGGNAGSNIMDRFCDCCTTMPLRDEESRKGKGKGTTMPSKTMGRDQLPA